MHFVLIIIIKTPTIYHLKEIQANKLFKAKFSQCLKLTTSFAVTRLVNIGS